MWKKSTLQLSPDVADAVKNGRAVNLTVIGQKIAVHNWTHGIKEASGRYLSPENAINVIAEKCSDISDKNRPVGEVEAIGIMLTSADIQTFIELLESTMVIMPDPALKQALDYAKSQQNLSETKMMKLPVVGYPAFAGETDITPQSARIINSIARNANATVARETNLVSVINQLKQKKAEREQQNQNKTTEILNTSASVYSFIAKAEISQLGIKLTKIIPEPSYIYTAVLFFVGKDLSNLRGMLND